MLLKFHYSIGEDGTLVFWNLKTGARAEPEAFVFFFFFFFKLKASITSLFLSIEP